MKPARALSVLVLGLVLAAAVLVPLLGQPPELPERSARSTGPAGRRALFLLLDELGFEASLWEQPPGGLLARPGESGGERGLLWLAAPPRGFDPELALDDPLERARARGNGAWSRYREHVAAGGVLFLPASAESAAFLTGALGLSAADCSPFEIPAELALAEALSSQSAASGVLELRDDAGKLVAREVALGAGAVVLVADGEWLANAELARPAHALAAVRLAERYALAPHRPLHFDEWALADEPLGSGLAGLLFGGAGGRAGLASWHGLALALLLAWGALARREFARDPRPEEEACAPVLRARATAAFLARHGRFDLLGLRLSESAASTSAGTAPPAPAVNDLAGLVALDRELWNRVRGERAALRRADRDGRDGQDGRNGPLGE